MQQQQQQPSAEVMDEAIITASSQLLAASPSNGAALALLNAGAVTSLCQITGERSGAAGTHSHPSCFCHTFPCTHATQQQRSIPIK